MEICAPMALVLSNRRKAYAKTEPRMKNTLKTASDLTPRPTISVYVL